MLHQKWHKWDEDPFQGWLWWNLQSSSQTASARVTELSSSSRDHSRRDTTGQKRMGWATFGFIHSFTPQAMKTPKQLLSLSQDRHSNVAYVIGVHYASIYAGNPKDNDMSPTKGSLTFLVIMATCRRNETISSDSPRWMVIGLFKAHGSLL